MMVSIRKQFDMPEFSAIYFELRKLQKKCIFDQIQKQIFQNLTVTSPLQNHCLVADHVKILPYFIKTCIASIIGIVFLFEFELLIYYHLTP